MLIIGSVGAGQGDLLGFFAGPQVGIGLITNLFYIICRSTQLRNGSLSSQPIAFFFPCEGILIELDHVLDGVIKFSITYSIMEL